ncbi:MAG: VCBS repeat-containing protein [Lysobacterales bacterium]
MKARKHPLTQAIRATLCAAVIVSPSLPLPAHAARADCGIAADAGLSPYATRTVRGRLRVAVVGDGPADPLQKACAKAGAVRIERVQLNDGRGKLIQVAASSIPRVESAKVSNGIAVDYGDAPAPYPTLQASNGASHVLAGPTLGALRDAETDGVPSVAADGDDLAGSDDEDGVSFGVAQVGATDNGVVVNVQGESGKLDAWIDFNGDGSWNGADEHIFDSVDVAVGDNTLFFDVPAEARSITTLSRMRITRAGGIGVGGSVDNGEVEDHILSLQAPNSSSGQFVQSEQVLETDTTTSTQVTVLADLDGDGDLDLFTGGYGGFTAGKSNRVYLNDGAGNLIDTGQRLGTDDTFGADAADVDGDGDIDVAAINLGQPIRLYANDGSGVLSLVQSLSAGNAADGRFADVDGDGDPDLIVGVLGNPDRIYLNDGTGTFSDSGQRLGTDSRTLGIAVGDVDNDGDIDFIEGNDRNDRNAVYLNDGTGTFSDSGQQLTNARTNGVVLGDVDGDGDLDLIEATSGGSILRLNDGSGGFSAGSSALPGSEILYDVALADVDGDGDLDLVEANYYGSNRVQLNDGSGNFSDSGQRLGATDSVTTSISVGDLDGDGDLDLVAGNYTQPDTVWINTELDYADAPAPYPTLLTADGARHVPVGPSLGSLRDSEINGVPSGNADGDDLAGVDDEDGVSFGTAQVGATDNGVVVKVQGEAGKLDGWIDFNGDGSWNGANEHVFHSVDVAVGDNTLFFDVPANARSILSQSRFRIRRDGLIGTAGLVDNGEVEDHTLLLQAPTSSSGLFGESEQVLETDTTTSTQVTVLADLDGDGDLDLFTGGYGGYTAGKSNRVYLNDGAGNLIDTGQRLGTDDTFGADAADVDGDGDIDVAAINLGQPIRLYANDGSGVLNLVQSLSAGNVADGRFVDVDSDGDPDLIVGVLGNPDRIYLNDGTGTFSDSGQRLGTDSRTLGIAVGDVDNDGDIDFIEGNDRNDRNAVYLNDGAGTFSDSGQQLTNARTNGVVLGDVDGDGDLDLIEATTGGSILRLNDGSGGFSAGSSALPGSDNIYDVALADVDGDGDLDLVEANYYGSNRVQLNDGSGNFSDSGQALGATDSVTTSISVGDLDGDGDLDLVAGNYRQPEKVWINGASPVELSVSASSGSEAAQSVITVTATATSMVASDQSVDLSVDGTGITSGDYSLSAMQIVIPGGSSSGSVSFTVLDDALLESDETATISITDYSVGLVAGTVLTQDILIRDNDAAPVLAGLSIAPGSFSENGGSTVLTASIVTESSQAGCFDLGFSGSAVVGIDYSSDDDDAGTAGTQVCVAAGDLSGTVTLTGIDDSIFEGDESLSVSSGAFSATATLSDDDSEPVLTALSIIPGSFSENGGTAILTGTVSNTSISDTCYTLSFGGAATLGSDYSSTDADAGTIGTQLCVAAGASSGTLTLTAIDDGVYEGDENLTASSAGQLASATISDDEPAPRVQSLAFTEASLSETDSDIFLVVTIDQLSDVESCQTVNLTGTATAGVDYSMSDDDPLTAGIQACVEAGSLETDLALTPLDDSVFEGDETIIASSGAGMASVTLVDNESAPAITSLAIAPTSFAENAGTAVLMAIVSNAATVDSCFDLGFSGAAILGTDYSSADDDAGTAGTQLCVAAGDTSGTLTLTGIDDNIFEGDENLSVSSGAFSAAATVSDDDSAPVLTALGIAPLSFGENGGVAVLAGSVSNASTSDACFDMNFAGAAQLDADYSSADDDAGSAGIQLCVAAGDLSGMLDLTAIDDTVFEGDESIVVESGAFSAAAILSDDDPAPTITSLQFSPASLAENGGSSSLLLQQSSNAAVVNCFDISYTGQAQSGIDYLSGDDDPIRSGTQLCVSAGDTESSLIITAIDDAVYEGSETLTASSGGAQTSAQLLDDEAVPVISGVDVDTAKLPETGGLATLQAQTSGPASTTRCFDVSFAGTASFNQDYLSEDQDPGSAGIQICVNALSQASDLIIAAVSDSEPEPDETISLQIGADPGSSATLFLIDDDLELGLFRDGFEDPVPTPPVTRHAPD